MLLIKFDTVKTGCSIVYYEGSQINTVIISNFFFLSLNIDFVLENTVQTLMKCRSISSGSSLLAEIPI